MHGNGIIKTVQTVKLLVFAAKQKKTKCTVTNYLDELNREFTDDKYVKENSFNSNETDFLVLLSYCKLCQ